ncbi:MAG TPA: ABC transporter substrate-binding protein, partial [Pyrinomonadaceae bacterium]|nr:ABC transporter substrate-binding protein [Pyrinomonadaceae bacterium]
MKFSRRWRRTSHAPRSCSTPRRRRTEGRFFWTRSSRSRALAVEPIIAGVTNANEIESAVATLARKAGGSLIIMPDAFNTVHRQLIILLAARHALPAVYPYRYQAVEGGLMSYGVDTVDLMRRAAPYVDRILKGEKPADLPVQAPVKFELVVNLRAARVIGLTIPPTLLA